MAIVGVPNRGAIPVTSVIDLTTGEITPGKLPYFPSVSQTFAEADHDKAESRREEGHIARPLDIDYAPFTARRRSSDPEIWAEQEKLLIRCFSLKAEAERLAARVVANEVKDLKIAHRDLVKACRLAVDAIGGLREDLGRQQQYFREAQNATKKAFLGWKHRRLCFLNTRQILSIKIGKQRSMLHKQSGIRRASTKKLVLKMSRKPKPS